MGKGAQTGITVMNKNIFLVSGLLSIQTADPQNMPGRAADFTVDTKQSFIDGLILGIKSWLGCTHDDDRHQVTLFPEILFEKAVRCLFLCP